MMPSLKRSSSWMVKSFGVYHVFQKMVRRVTFNHLIYDVIQRVFEEQKVLTEIYISCSFSFLPSFLLIKKNGVEGKMFLHQNVLGTKITLKLFRCRWFETTFTHLSPSSLLIPPAHFTSSQLFTVYDACGMFVKECTCWPTVPCKKQEIVGMDEYHQERPKGWKRMLKKNRVHRINITKIRKLLLWCVVNGYSNLLSLLNLQWIKTQEFFFFTLSSWSRRLITDHNMCVHQVIAFHEKNGRKCTIHFVLIHHLKYLFWSEETSSDFPIKILLISLTTSTSSSSSSRVPCSGDRITISLCLVTWNKSVVSTRMARGQNSCRPLSHVEDIHGSIGKYSF